MKCVNKWFVIANSAILLCGLAAAIAGLYYLIHSGTKCQHAQGVPLVIESVFLALVSITGLVAVGKKSNVVMLVYLVLMLALILGFIGNTVFTGYSFKNGKFPSGKNWDPTCMAEGLAQGNLCKSLQTTPSSIQSGCCQPPSDCGFHMKNATFWEVPALGPAPDDLDCRKWSNNRDKLCYECNSCKVELLESFKRTWDYMLILYICLIVVLLGVYSIGCCAWRRNKRDGLNYEGVAVA